PYVELVWRRVSSDAGTLGLVTKIERALEGLDATLSSVAQMASDRQPSLTRVSLASLANEVCKTFETALDAQDIRVEVNVAARLQIVADRDMFRRALMNLVFNAIEAMPDGGDLVITGYEGPRGVELEVADSGPGLLGDARNRAFEPFFTTKAAG